MTVLWQSSWFWLMISTLLLILAGCAVLNGYNYTRGTETANSPLLSLTNTPFASFLHEDRLSDSLYFPMNTSVYHQQAPPGIDDIRVNMPRCFSLPGGELSCLGQIWNNTAEDIGDTQVNLEFFDQIGQKIGEQATTLEQRITPPGAFAPYRAIVNADLANKLDNNSNILTSIANQLPVARNIGILNILEARGHITESGRYNLTVAIQNDSGFDAREIRIFTTLSGDNSEIIGYNIYQVGESLNNGEQQLVQVEVIPHAIPQRIEHHLHAEALISH